MFKYLAFSWLLMIVRTLKLILLIYQQPENRHLILVLTTN